MWCVCLYWGFIVILLTIPHICVSFSCVLISLWVLYNFILGVSGSRAAFLRFLFFVYLNTNSINFTSL